MFDFDGLVVVIYAGGWFWWAFLLYHVCVYINKMGFKVNNGWFKVNNG